MARRRLPSIALAAAVLLAGAGCAVLSPPERTAREQAPWEAATTLLLVEALEVGVYPALPEKPDVDGLLGADFPRSFRATLDRAGKRLILEVQ